MKYLIPVILFMLISPALAQVPVRVIDGPGPTPPADMESTTTTATSQTSNAPPAADPNAPAGTISYYMAHSDERKTLIQRCDDDPGHLDNAPNCINARKADDQAGLNNFKNGVSNTIQGAVDFFDKL